MKAHRLRNPSSTDDGPLAKDAVSLDKYRSRHDIQDSIESLRHPAWSDGSSIANKSEKRGHAVAFGTYN
jgi:hypothetical protein